MRNGVLEEAQAGFKIAGRNINKFRYADDISIIAGWFFNNWANGEIQILVYVKLNHFTRQLKHNMVNQIYSNEKI